jgi:hypothetical protein
MLCRKDPLGLTEFVLVLDIFAAADMKGSIEKF